MLLFALEPWGVVTIIVVAVVLLVLLLVGVSYVKAPPNTAFIITGPFKQRTLIGRAGFRIPGLERVDKIPLSLIQVDIKTASAVPTKEFINIFTELCNASACCRSLPSGSCRARSFAASRNSRNCANSGKKIPR